MKKVIFEIVHLPADLFGLFALIFSIYMHTHVHLNMLIFTDNMIILSLSDGDS